MNKPKSLKTIPRDIYDSFISDYFSSICKQKNKEITINISPSNKSIIIVCDDNKDAHLFINNANKHISLAFNDFIEKKMNDSCKKYVRNLVLFTSTIDDEINSNKIILNWS